MKHIIFVLMFPFDMITDLRRMVIQDSSIWINLAVRCRSPVLHDRKYYGFLT